MIEEYDLEPLPELEAFLKEGGEYVFTDEVIQSQSSKKQGSNTKRRTKNKELESKIKQ